MSRRHRVSSASRAISGEALDFRKTSRNTKSWEWHISCSGDCREGRLALSVVRWDTNRRVELHYGCSLKRCNSGRVRSMYCTGVDSWSTSRAFRAAIGQVLRKFQLWRRSGAVCPSPPREWTSCGSAVMSSLTSSSIASRAAAWTVTTAARLICQLFSNA